MGRQVPNLTLLEYRLLYSHYLTEGITAEMEPSSLELIKKVMDINRQKHRTERHNTNPKSSLLASFQIGIHLAIRKVLQTIHIRTCRLIRIINVHFSLTFSSIGINILALFLRSSVVIITHNGTIRTRKAILGHEGCGSIRESEAIGRVKTRDVAGTERGAGIIGEQPQINPLPVIRAIRAHVEVIKGRALGIIDRIKICQSIDKIPVLLILLR